MVLDEEKHVLDYVALGFNTTFQIQGPFRLKQPTLMMNQKCGIDFIDYKLF